MAFDENLAERARHQLDLLGVGFSEKKMFGGLSFLVGGNMCVGVVKDELIVRLAAADQESALKRPHIRPMDFTGKPMKGWLTLSAEGSRSDRELGFWIDQAVSFVRTLPAK